LKRLLLPTTAFIRSGQRLVRKQPRAATELQMALALLAEDAFHPQLKTYKLRGKLIGSWACSAAYALGNFLIRDSLRRLLQRKNEVRFDDFVIGPASSKKRCGKSLRELPIIPIIGLWFPRMHVA
jgi:mRNA-degrading endonuclease YafQ of YafQ-DinJ toxin-antitoxin module